MKWFSLPQHRAKNKAIDFKVKMKTNVLILETLMQSYIIQSHDISAFICNIIWMEKHHVIIPLCHLLKMKPNKRLCKWKMKIKQESFYKKIKVNNRRKKNKD